MKTLTQFKQENNVANIDLLQKNGRAFASVGDKRLVVSKECDMKKPLFVIPLTKAPVTEGEQGEVIPNAYLLINSEIKITATV